MPSWKRKKKISLVGIKILVSSLVLLFVGGQSFAAQAIEKSSSQNSLGEFAGQKANTKNHPLNNLGFDQWIVEQEKVSIDWLRRNISPQGALPGVVIASPSRRDPDYFFHWIRDAALVMDVLVEDVIRNPRSSDVQKLNRTLRDFVNVTRINQRSDAPTGLGEPKFHVDGRPYKGPWGRPQNDGPALRAFTLAKWAFYLLENNGADYVRNHLYRPEIPAHTVIKADLEYVSHNWRNASFDLWEETLGDHFYTRVVQFASMKIGAKLAERMGDANAAKWYHLQGVQIKESLARHWSKSLKRILITVNQVGGLNYKHSGLDAATLLSILHTGKFSPLTLDAKPLLSTLAQIENSFADVYRINQKGLPATLIGRYPEDRYFRGNPWVLTTAAFAEHQYLLAQKFMRTGKLAITPELVSYLRGFFSKAEMISMQRKGVLSLRDPMAPMFLERLIDHGDQILRRIKVHVPKNLSLWEQMDKEHGFMLSARDLTWSYASFLTAVRERKLAKKMLSRVPGPLSGNKAL